MKSEKAMSYKMLIFIVLLIMIAVITSMYLLNNRLKSEIVKTYKTDMLLIQGKTKVLSQESIVQKKEDILKGEKIADKLEDEKVKELLEKNVISQDEEKFAKYYIWNKDVLNEVGLSDIKLEIGFYIVNYDTDEIIYSEGIKVDDKIYYKLSEIEKYENEVLNEETREKLNEEVVGENEV